jgi:spore coat polysaccharide biosynthesis protein SpsF
LIEKGKLIAVVQTRMGSTRLPGKVMKEICGKPMLQLMLERLSKSKLIDEIVVATTTNPNDNVISDFAKKNGYNVFRGSEFDCLDRHYKTAIEFNASYIAKITPDCPLIDPEVIDIVLDYFLKHLKQFDYVSNAHPPSWPDGLDFEVFHFSTLEKAHKEATTKEHREHTTTYIWSNPDKFLLGNVLMSNGKNFFKNQRWTVDFPEDFEFVKKIYENLYKKDRIFFTNEILSFLEKRPDISKINEHLTIHNAVH